jgi:hypothetical protein
VRPTASYDSGSLTSKHLMDTRAADAELVGDGGLPFKRNPASVHDADTLDHQRDTALIPHP